MAPTPFTIRIPDATLADLRERLDRVRWPDEIPGAGWQYGTDLTYLRQLVDYWRTQYDWRVHEARLNAFQQFTVPLSEIDVHFIHQPGIGPAPLPLLLLHGWPGSVWEFYKRRFSQGKIGSHSPPPPPVFFEDLAPFCEWIFLPPELDCHALIPV